MSQKLQVLSLLKKRRRKGVTVRDFPIGFRLASRIFDLRGMGHEIDTVATDPVAVYRIKT